MKEITIESVREAIDKHGFRKRKELAEYFNVHRKYKPLIRILDEYNLLIRENNPLSTKENAEKEIRIVYDYLGHAPTVKEFDDIADKLNLTLRSDMIRKNIFREKWSVILNFIFGDGTIRERKILNDADLLGYIRKFVKDNRRLPLYDDFNKNPKYPSYDTYKERFGNFTNAIEKAGVSDVTEKLRYGTRITYKRHIFKSFKEYSIGRILIDNGIEFEQENPYGIGNYKFDFYIPSIDTYIEYYGLYNKVNEYTITADYKRTLYGNRKVIEIFPTDNINKIMREVVESSTTRLMP